VLRLGVLANIDKERYCKQRGGFNQTLTKTWRSKFIIRKAITNIYRNIYPKSKVGERKTNIIASESALTLPSL
jgi:hypothetical protein